MINLLTMHLTSELYQAISDFTAIRNFPIISDSITRQIK